MLPLFPLLTSRQSGRLFYNSRHGTDFRRMKAHPPVMQPRRERPLLLLGMVLCLVPRAEAAPNQGVLSSKVDFNRDIRPIITQNCFKCHGPDDGARKPKLRFDV